MSRPRIVHWTRSTCWLLLAAALTAGADEGPRANYVGSQTCVACHPNEFERWRGSYHDRAMTEATESTVLGDFGDREVTAQGVTSRFFRRDGRYYVRTDGPDGQLQDYPIRYTFGWWPLQQYLIEFPGGRLQSLGIAWDSRTQEAGGQRWFHLYPEEGIGPGHPLHWTSRDQNWNYQCAECHSTNLRKGYDLATDTFHTTWSEIDVACEACHGPASRHVAQAQPAPETGQPTWDAAKGLVVDLADRDGGVWRIDAATGRPQRSVFRSRHTQIEVCARCHARRGQLTDPYVHGQPLGDTHRLALLGDGLYEADGQIKEEVYEYGSFVQSRMYQQGVTCGDCHDPHGLVLKAPGNLVCAQCHLAGRYDTEGHHHHPPGSESASCVACHMPQRLYMVVDARSDHSLRIPRPDLTLKIGTPNACNDCHRDQTPQWAANAVRQWYGDALTRQAHFGEVFHAADTGARDAGPRLMALAADTTQPAIVRATALDRLHDFPAPTHRLTLPRLLKDADDLVRAAAVRSLEVTDPEHLLELGLPLLDDPILAVRTEAARLLAPFDPSMLPDDVRRRLNAALDEYRATQGVNAERPESHLNLGLIETALNDAGAAEAAYRTAMRLDPGFGPAYVNLADLKRALGRDAEGEQVLRAGLAAVPNDASLHHALGLLQIRRRELPQAVASLARAAELAPDDARYAYVYALAVRHTGDLERALAILRAALDRHPTDPDILVALVTFNQERGDQEAVGEYAKRLDALRPSKPRP